MAEPLIDVLRRNVRSGKFLIHDFVVMPNHVHILLTIPGTVGLERGVQLIKGGFSYRAKRELGFQGDIWQRGFPDVRIIDDLSRRQHRAYIDNNPVKAGLASAPEDYPCGTAFLKMRKESEAKVAL